MITIGIIAFVAGVILTIFSYHKNLRSSLPIIRLLALAMILLIFTRSVIHYTRAEQKKIKTKILVDISQSMSHHHRPKFVQGIIEKFKTHCLTFAEKTSGQPKGNATNISAAIRSLNDNPGPIILVTDGNYNQGANPIDIAGSYPYPVYPIRMPKETINNFKVKRIEGPDYLFVGDTGNFIIECQSSGVRGQIDITINQNNKMVQRKFIRLEGDGVTAIEFPIIAKSPGRKKVEIAAKSGSPEIDYTDNRARYQFEVNASRFDLLFVSNLSPNIGIIRRTISEMRWINPEFRIRIDNEKKVEFGKLIGRPEIIVIDNVSNLSDMIPNLKEWLTSDIGLVVLFGNNMKLPIFDLDISEISRMQNVVPQPDPQFMASNISLPPFDNVIDISDNTKGGQEILTANDGSPLALSYTRGNGKLIILLAYPFWKFYLRLLGAGHENTAVTMIKRLIELASPFQRKKRVVVHRIERKLKLGEPVEISCGYYSHELKPISAGRIYFTILKDGLESELIGHEKKSGFYSAQWRPEKSGEYKIIAHAGDDSDTTAVSVGDVHIEKSYQPINRSLLFEIARITGGKIIDGSQIQQHTKEFTVQEKERKKFSFDSPWVGIIAIGLLSLEWFLRKKKGLA